MIPYGKQNITEEDISAVVDVLKSDYLTQGPLIPEFENQFKTQIHSQYATVVNNGTSALHLAALGANVQKGDKWLTCPLTFVATANSILYCGGEVDFVDIDANTLTIDLNQLEDKLKTGKYKGVLPIDFAGYPVRMDLVKQLADKYGVKIIEDACHAPGAWFTDVNNEMSYSGSCQYSDLAVFSFHPVKHIATGEGGMVTTANSEIDEKIKLLRTHGITRDENKMHENHGGWYMEMQELGYNYRIPDILCALGISQLKRLEASVIERNRIAKIYDSAFVNMDIETIKVPEDIRHAYHLYVIQTDQRKELYNFLKTQGIAAQIHYVPVHLMPYYKNLGFKLGDFPKVESYYKKGLSIPIYPGLGDTNIQLVIDKISEFVSSN